MIKKSKTKIETYPLNIAQKVFREWCSEWHTVVEVHAAADLVRRIEASIIQGRYHLPGVDRLGVPYGVGEVKDGKNAQSAVKPTGTLMKLNPTPESLMPRVLHRWTPPERESSELSIRRCTRCTLTSLSHHDWNRNRHWKEYYTHDAPDVRLLVMPECVRTSEEVE